MLPKSPAICLAHKPLHFLVNSFVASHVDGPFLKLSVLVLVLVAVSHADHSTSFLRSYLHFCPIVTEDNITVRRQIYVVSSPHTHAC